MILLISQNKKIATETRQGLVNEGFQVDHIEQLDRAYAHLVEKSSYDLLLVDFDGEGYERFEICQRIKRLPGCEALPILGILPREKMVDQIMAFEMGVDDFIFMPYTQLEIPLKIRAVERMGKMRLELQRKKLQVEHLKNAQRIMVTLNHYINNALTPLYFAVQIMDMQQGDEAERLRDIARDTVEFTSKVLQSLHQIVQRGKIQVLKDGVYKDIMIDIERELQTLLKKTRATGKNNLPTGKTEHES